jgi:hypothetical protein
MLFFYIDIFFRCAHNNTFNKIKKITNFHCFIFATKKKNKSKRTKIIILGIKTNDHHIDQLTNILNRCIYIYIY